MAKMKQWFAYSNGGGIRFYETEAEARQDAEEELQIDRDEATRGGEWSPETGDIRVGRIILAAQPANVIKRPPEDQLADGYDEDGNDWTGGHAEICDYTLQPVAE